jgi:glycosyltransferase involved in cell wall biosynthesis
MQTVIILQEYVPQYRVQFFERLIALGSAHSIQIKVAAGQASDKQNKRQDGIVADFIFPIRQREFRLGKRRVVIRTTRPAVQSADLIIMEQARRNIDAYRFLLWPWRSQKICLWGHGKDFVSSPSRLSRALLTRLTNAADWFFAYTEGSRDAVVGAGFPASQTTVVRNSIDTRELQDQLLKVSQDEIADFRKQNGLTNSTAVFIGGLDESKRLPFLFEAGKRAHEKDSDFRLVVMGSGPQKAYVEDTASNEPWLKYLGPRFGRDKAIAIASSEVICMPGRVGLVAVDSFAAARPIVTTTWPWHGPEFEYLDDGQTCVVTTDSEEAYAEAVVALLRDRARLVAMQESCQNARADYSIDAMASRFFEGIQLALKHGTR